MIDPAFLAAFEARLDPADPLRAGTGATIVGYGEISTVFKLAGRDDLIFKRMAGFRANEIAPYCAAVERYVALLASRGVEVTPTATVALPGREVVYVVQPAFRPEQIGNRIVRDGHDAEVRALLRAVLAQVRSPWESGAVAPRLGFDAQISNWGWADGRARYIDVSTPLIRDAGGECLDPEIALRSMPRLMAWGFRRWALQGILDRYYDLREVLKDVAANFVKEGRPDRIPLALGEINPLLEAHAQAPLTPPEVLRYYRHDARMWRVFQAARRIDRFWRTRIRRARYDYILPGPVAR